MCSLVDQAIPPLNLIALPSYQASHFALGKCMPSYGCRMQDYALADSSYHIATLLLTLVAGSMGKRIIHGVLDSHITRELTHLPWH